MYSQDIFSYCYIFDLYGCDKRRGVFSISRGNTMPPFEMKESIFDKMPPFIQRLVIMSLRLPVLLWGNHHFHSPFFHLVNSDMTVIATICQQMICSHPFDQAASLRAISRGTWCNKDSNRHTIMRIHGQMYLGVESPFVRLIA